MAPQGTTIPVVNNTLTDVTLWARIDIPRYIRVTECELASAIISAAGSEQLLRPKDILGVQLMSGSHPFWIVNLASKQAKARILATDSIQIQGKSFKISDYTSSQKTKEKNTRLSIHGIPQNVADSEVTSWVGAFATVASPIFRHKTKDKGLNGQFHHLHTGHRFCYVSEIKEHKPRYSMMDIPNPLDPKSLITVEVTLYYTGQSENFCKYCHSCEHQIGECPNIPQKKCHHCGQSDHVKASCPHKEKGPKCFACQCFGHLSYNCPTRAEDEDRSSRQSPLQSPPQSPPISRSISRQSLQSESGGESSKIAVATALAQELIDHCLNPESSKSPELLEKVKSVLNIQCNDSKSTPSTPSLSRKQQKKVNKSAKNNHEQSTGTTKKKQQKLFESSKSSSSSKRKAITPVRNELPDKREKTEEDSSSSHNNPRTVGQKIMSMLSPQKQDNELLS